MYKFFDIVKPGSNWEERNGVYFSLDEPFQTNCHKFLRDYYANNPNTLITNDYKKLPYVTDYRKNNEWNFRVHSLNVMKEHVNKCRPKRILEIGPWNGWLTHRLAPYSDLYVSCDFFDDDRNGLASFRNYETANWIPVHCDVEDLKFFAITFDLIIYNHCLQFFEHWERSIQQAKMLLNSNGYIYILGSTIFQDCELKEKMVKEAKSNYFKRTGTNLFFRETKGYFDEEDKKKMKNSEFRIKQYRRYFVNNVLRFVLKSRPQVCYAVYTKMK